MHVIRVGSDGMVQLIPASSWRWEGNHDPASWTVRVRAYGPSTSTTWNLPASGVVFVRWGGTPGQPYVGTGPLSWAHTTARLQSETERSLADEAGGPLAQLLAIPSDGGDDSDSDPLKLLAPISPALAAKRCLWRQAQPVGAKARRPRHKPTGSNTGSGRCRPSRWRRSAKIHSRPSWPRVEHRHLCFSTPMARRSARP